MEQDSGKLFIGGISWETNEDRLTEYFGRFGDVAEAVIMRDRITGRARGFGFIVFADPAVAERVTMEKHMIDGRMVEAKKAVPRDDQTITSKQTLSGLGSPGPARTRKIFVGGLPSSITESDFKSYFEQFGSISDTVVMYDHNTQRPRGFGFVTYDSEESVDKVLLKSTFHQLNGKMVEVKRAVPKELSPGPHTKSSIGSNSINSNYPLTRINNVLNGYGPSYGSNPLSSYGRFGLLSAAGRNGFAGYGIGIDQGITSPNPNPNPNPSFGGGSGLGGNPNFGWQVNPYYSRNGSRFGSPSPNPNPHPIGYTGVDSDTRSVFSSVVARNLRGNIGNSTSPSSFGSSGIGNIGSFDSNNNNINNNMNWGQIMGENSGFGSAGGGYGRNNGIGNVNSNSFDNGYEGKNSEGYNGNSIYGDKTWNFTSTELDSSNPFGYTGHYTEASGGIAS